MLPGSKLKRIALCVILALCLHSTEGDVSDQNQAVSHREKGRGRFLAATGSFRLTGLVPREEERSLGERNVVPHALAELDSADDLLDDDDQFETKKTERHSTGIRLGLADDDEDEDFEHSFDYSRLSKGDAQSSLKDTVSVQVSNFICTAKGPQCEGKTCDLDEWTQVSDRKICIKGDEETEYCLVFEEDEEDDSDRDEDDRIGGMMYNYKATQERTGTPSQGGTKGTTEMKPNGVQAVIATTAAQAKERSRRRQSLNNFPEETEDGVQTEDAGQCFFTMQHRKIGIPLAKEADEAEEDADADADAEEAGSSLQVEYVKLTLCKADRVNEDMQTDSIENDDMQNDMQHAIIENAFDVWRNKIELPTRYEGKECKVEKVVLDTQLCHPTAAGKVCSRTKSNRISLKDFQERCMEDEEGACPKVHDYLCGDCEGCKKANGDCNKNEKNANQCSGTKKRVWCGGKKRGDSGCGACQGCQKDSGHKTCSLSYRGELMTQTKCSDWGSSYKWCGEDPCAKCTSEFKAFAFNEESEMIAAMVI